MSKVSIIPIKTCNEPPAVEGRRALQFDVDLSNGSAIVDLTPEMMQGQISQIPSLYFDNGANSFPVTIIIDGTFQRLTFAPFTQGYVNLLLPKNARIAFSSGTPVVFKVNFLNWLVEETTWSVLALAGPFVPLAGGTMTGPLVMAATTIVPDSLKGIVGTITSDSAQAGSIGEFFENVITQAAPIAILNGAQTNLTSINLPVGDFDVEGSLLTVPNPATTTSFFSIGISDVSNTLPASERRFQGHLSPNVAGGGLSGALPRQRISLAVPKTIYLVALLSFAVNTMSICGYINARRIR